MEEKDKDLEELDSMFEELDSIGTSSSDSGSRDPITDVTDIGKKAARNLTDPGQVLEKVKDKIKDSLPDPIDDELDKAKKINDEILEPIASSFRKARSVASSVTSTVADILPEIPGVTTTLRKIADAIKPDEEEKYGSGSSEESEDEVVKNNVNEVFGEQRTEDRIKEKLEQVQKLNELELNIRNVSNVEILKDYFLKDHYNYIRKNLELQFKQTLALIDLRNRFGVFTKEHLELLKAVVKNTGLPDVVKINNKEMIEDQIKQRMFSKGIDLFTNNNFIKRLKENVTDSIINKIENYTSSADMGVDTIKNVSELLDTLPPEEKREAAAGIISDFVLGLATNKVFNKVKESKVGNKVFGTVGKTIQKSLNDPSVILEKIAPESVKNSSWYNEFVSIIKDAKREGDIKDIDIKETDYTKPAVFDLQVKKSITAVIPNLLSKIINEIRALRTGKVSKEDELVFDYSKNKFIKRADVKKELIKELDETKKNFKDSISNGSSYLINKFLGNNYTDEDLAKFKKGIENIILTGKSLSVYDWYNNSSILEMFDESIRDKVEKGIKRLVETKDLNTMVDINSIENQLRRIKKYATINSTKMDLIREQGFIDDLEELHIVDKDTDVIRKDTIKTILHNGKDSIPTNNKTDKKNNNKSISKNSKLENKLYLPIIANTIRNSDNKLLTIIKLLSNIKNKLNTLSISFNKNINKVFNKNIENLNSSISKISDNIVNNKLNTSLQPNIIKPLPLNNSYNINNATLNINNANLKGMENILTDMSKSITKIIDTNIGKNLVNKLNKTYETITSKSMEEYKQLLSLSNIKNFATDKLTYGKDIITNSNLYKNINNKISDFKSHIDIKKYIETKFKDRLIPIEETNEKGEKETYYLLELGKNTLVLPITALSSPITLTKAIKEQVSLQELPYVLKELLPSKDNVKNKFTDIKDFINNNVINKVKKTSIYDKIISKIDNFKQSDNYNNYKGKIDAIINNIKSSDKYKNISEKLSNVKVSLKDKLLETFKDRIIEIEEPDDNGNIEKNYLIEFGKHTLIIPAMALSSPKLFYDTLVSQVGKEEAIEILKEMFPSKETITNGFDNVKDKLWSFISKEKNDIKENGIFGFFKNKKDKVVTVINNKIKGNENIENILNKLKTAETFKDKLNIYNKLPDSIKQLITVDEGGNFIVSIDNEIIKLDKEGLLKILPIIKDKLEKGTINTGNNIKDFLSRTKDNFSNYGIAGGLVGLASDLRKGLTNILKEHKDVPKELIKQMFRGKDILKGKVNIPELIKAFTFGSLKSSFWFGRNVLRPGYKKMFSAVGDIAHKTAVMTLRTAFGFSPETAETVVGMIEAPFKIVSKALDGVNKVLAKTKDLFKGFFNVIGKLGKLFLSKTWKLVKKGISFLTGKSEEEIDEKTTNIKNKVKSGTTYLKNKWSDIENKNILTKTLMSPVRNISKLGINAPVSLVKGIGKLGSSMIITDEEEKNLWLNRKLDSINSKSKSLSSKIKDVLFNRKTDTDKYVDEEGRTVVTLNKFSKEKPKDYIPVKPVNVNNDIIKNNIKNNVEDNNTDNNIKDNIKSKTTKEEKTDKIKEVKKDTNKENVTTTIFSKLKNIFNKKENKTIKREEKIEKLRDSLEKEKESSKLKTDKDDKSYSSFSLISLLAIGISVLKNINKWLPKLGGIVKNLGTTIVKGSWSAIKWLGKTTINGIKALGKNILSGITNAIKGIGTFISDGIKKILPTNLIKNAKEGISKTITTVKDKAKNVYESVKHFVTGDKQESSILGKLWNGVKSIAGNIKDKIVGKFNSVKDILKHKWSSVKDAVSYMIKTPYVKNLVNKIKNKIPVLKKAVVMKLGKEKAGSLLAKLGSRLIPGIGSARLLWDAGFIAWDVLQNHTPLLSAISKQLLGIDIFNLDKEKIDKIDLENIKDTTEQVTDLVKNNKKLGKKFETVDDKTIKQHTDKQDNKIKINNSNLHTTDNKEIIIHNNIDDKYTKMLVKTQEKLLDVANKQLSIQDEINDNLKTLTELFVSRLERKENNTNTINRKTTDSEKNIEPAPQPVVVPSVHTL